MAIQFKGVSSVPPQIHKLDITYQFDQQVCFAQLILEYPPQRKHSVRAAHALRTRPHNLLFLLHPSPTLYTSCALHQLTRSSQTPSPTQGVVLNLGIQNPVLQSPQLQYDLHKLNFPVWHTHWSCLTSIAAVQHILTKLVVANWLLTPVRHFICVLLFKVYLAAGTIVTVVDCARDAPGVALARSNHHLAAGA